MVGTGAVFVAASFLINPFGVIGLIAVAASLGALLRGLRPPKPVRCAIGRRFYLPAAVSLVCQLLAWMTTLPVLLGALFVNVRPPMVFEVVSNWLF